MTAEHPRAVDYTFGPFRLIPARRLLLRRDTPIPLTPKAFDTLLALVERRDHVVTKDELLEQVWRGVAVEEANITQQVFLLRKALGEPAEGKEYVTTVPRRGYRFVADVAEVAGEPDTGQPAAHRRVRNWGFLAGLSGAAVIIAVAAFLAPHPPGAVLDPGTTLTQLTRDAETESFPSVSPDGREFVYAAGPLDYAGESDIYRRDIGLERGFNLTPDSPGADTQPAFSPDGSLIAFRSDRDGGGIFVMHRDGSAVRPLTHDGYNPAWAPDGSEVAYATIQTTASPYSNPAVRSALWAVSLRTGVRRMIRERGAAAPAWSPHGHRIAYWAGNEIFTCGPDGSDATTVVTRGTRLNWNPVWSPDGRYLYFSSDRSGPMHLWRIRVNERTGRPTGVAEPVPVPMPSTFTAHPSFDASGRRLLFTSCPRAASIQRIAFDLEAGVVRGELEPVTARSHLSVWPEPSPDGSRISFHRGDAGRDEDIFVGHADGSDVHRVTDDPALDRVPRWSPDGRTLAFYSGRGGQANIWMVGADGRDLRQVTRSSAAPLIFPVWSPDGRLAASEAGPGSRTFVFGPEKPWDAPGNLQELPPPDSETQFVPWSWSPGGDRLAGFPRALAGRSSRPAILILILASGVYQRFPVDGRQPTPVWLPDGVRLLYAAQNRLMLLDSGTGRSREVLNAGTGRIELAAGGGFGLSAATGHIYLAPVVREGDIWMASASR